MSKKAKAASKKRRQDQKRTRKAARRALYESYRDRGVNSKSRRARNNVRAQSSLRRGSHPEGRCGNPGCMECFGIRFKPFLVKSGPRDMPHWMWLRWSKLSKEERKQHAA